MAEHVDAMRSHAPGLTFDYVIADPGVVTTGEDALRDACESVGAELVVSGVSKLRAQGQHDTLRLAAAFRDVMSHPSSSSEPPIRLGADTRTLRR